METENFTAWFSVNQFISTAVLFAAFFLLRYLAETLLRGPDDFVNADRRRLISYSKNTCVLLLTIGLMLIWAPALRTFALSVTAFLVALVLATKEIILCITGGLLRTSVGAFSVGDWVRIGDKRGEVMHQSLLSVTLQELEDSGGGNQFTGRTISLPNSVFLSTQVINENFYKKFVYHTITLTVEKDDDPLEVATWMETAFQHAMADSLEVAQRYNALVKKRAGMDMPGVEPRTRFGTSPEGRPRVSVTAFIPTGQTEAIERAVMAELFGKLHQRRRQPA